MLALGYFTAKNGTRVAANLAEKALGKPPLVREFSGRGLFRPAREALARLTSTVSSK